MQYKKIKPYMIYYALRKREEVTQQIAANELGLKMQELIMYEKYGIIHDEEAKDVIENLIANFVLNDNDLIRIWIKYFCKNINDACHKLEISRITLFTAMKGYRTDKILDIITQIKKDLV